mgnify:FL=1
MLNYNELRSILLDIMPDADVSPQLATTIEVRQYLSNHTNYDCIFADIRLADGLVFDALSGLPKDKPVVFSTAYDEYALQAFDFNGIAYLLKPLRHSDVEKAVQRIKAMGNNQYEFIPQLIAHFTNQQRTKCYRQRFLISRADYSEVVSIDNLSHIMTENGITRLYLANGHSAAVNHTLDELEQQLDPTLFFRANRQYIVHIAHVKRLYNWFKGKTQLHIDCYPDLRIDVSKDRSSKIKRWLDR